MLSTAAQLAHLGGIQVCDVLHGAGVVSVVPLLNHGVEQVSKHLEASGMMCSTADPAPHEALATSLAQSCCQCGGRGSRGAAEGGWGPWRVLQRNGHPRGQCCWGKRGSGAGRRRSRDSGKSCSEEANRPLQLAGLGGRRWPVMSQATGCTRRYWGSSAIAGTLESLEHSRALDATHLVGFFIASYHAHCLDEGVARVVDTRLDALVQGPAVWGCFVTEPGIDGGRQVAGHAVVVLPQVRVLGTAGGEADESFGARGPQHSCPYPTATQTWAGERQGGRSSCSACPCQQRPAGSTGIAQRG